jgi:hypothetical protein
MDVNSILISGMICRGNGDASGQNTGSEYAPDGKIKLQKPIFERIAQSGGINLDLSHMHNGTINIDISPWAFEVLVPDLYFPNVHWWTDKNSGNPTIENFALVKTTLWRPSGVKIGAFIYYVQPVSTEAPSTMEILAPFIQGLNEGDSFAFEVNQDSIELL